jgi:ligand-binding sensor domain-containing protein
MAADSAGGYWFGTEGGLSYFNGLRWRTYTVADGLLGDATSHLLVDRLGNVWAASSGASTAGVSRYDGTRWSSYTYEDVGIGNVTAMIEDPSGKLWFASASRLTVYDGAAWRTYVAPDTLYFGAILKLLYRADGSIWVGTEFGGVVKFYDSTWTPLGLDDTYERRVTFPLFEDRSGVVWAASRYGINRYEAGGWTMITDPQGPGEANIAVILQDSTGTLWFAGDLVSSFDGKMWERYAADGEPAYGSFSSAALDRTGGVWVGSYSLHNYGQGAYRFDGSTWSRFTIDDGLASNAIKVILAVDDGSLWFATDGGVSRFDGAGWRVFDPDSIPVYGAKLVMEDRANDMWFASPGNGVTRFDGKTWDRFAIGGGHGGGTVTAMLEDRSGTLWFGTYETGLYRYDGQSFEVYTYSNGLPSNRIGALLEDTSGVLWVGSDAGISRYVAGNWETFPDSLNLSASLLFEDREGRIWGTASYSRVAFRYDGTSWARFPLSHSQTSQILQAENGDLWFIGEREFFGGSSDRYDGRRWRSYSDSLASTVMIQDRNGRIWSAAKVGASEYDGTSWKIHSAPDGPAGMVLTIEEDESGNIWFGTTEGTAVYNGSRWLTNVKRDDGNSIVYTQAIFEDSRRRLWFCTYSDGVVLHDVDRVAPKTILLSAPPALSAARNQVATFTAALGENAPVEFSYQLDDAPWSPWSTLDAWTTTGLQDGLHVFRVRSRDAFSNIEASPATASFRIDATPPGPVIASPASGQPLVGTITIFGTAADERFKEYRLDFRPSRAATWDPPVATQLLRSLQPRTSSILGYWNTDSLPDGDYDLRLSVTDELGLIGTTFVTAIVDNEEPTANETTPVHVRAPTGGHVFTTNREVHVYFPPRAFAQDTDVVVVPIPRSDAPDSGQSLPATGPDDFFISWGGIPLARPAVLDISLPESGTAGSNQELAIFFVDSTTTRQRLGGTISADGRVISTAISMPGRYSVDSDIGGASEGAGIVDFAITPRVFSLQGSSQPSDIAISFNLARSGPVSLRIYNRAGRLIRDLGSDVSPRLGANVVRWDLRDEGGSSVSDDLYIVVIDAGGVEQTRTLAVAR